MTDDSHLVTVTAGSVVALGSAATDCHASLAPMAVDWSPGRSPPPNSTADLQLYIKLA